MKVWFPFRFFVIFCLVNPAILGFANLRKSVPLDNLFPFAKAKTLCVRHVFLFLEYVCKSEQILC